MRDGEFLFVNKKKIVNTTFEYVSGEETSDGFCNTWKVVTMKNSGHTVANALRRSIMSYASGVAVIAVKISGAENPFSVVYGIKQPISEVIFNITGIRFDISDADFTSSVVTFSKNDIKGEFSLFASGFSGVAISNPDHFICSSVDSNLSISLLIARGSGFELANDHDISNLGSDWIHVDSLFNPVTNIKYSVYDHGIDNDVILLDVTTTGVNVGRNLLNEAFDILSHIFPSSNVVEVVDNVEKELDVPFLDTPFNNLDNNFGLRPRTLNTLSAAGVKTIRQLISYDEKSLSEINGIGDETLRNIIDCLSQYKLKLSERVRKNG